MEVLSIMKRKVYEITSMDNYMPVDDTTQYNSEAEAIAEADKLGLVEGIDYLITWMEE
jgi:hypothetical protein